MDKILQLHWAAKFKLLPLTGRLMHYTYMHFFIFGTVICLLSNFNQFYEEGYLKFSVSENRSAFGFSFNILNFY